MTRAACIPVTLAIALAVGATSASALSETARITTAGLGSVKLGMTAPEVGHAVNRPITLTSTPGSPCAIVTLAPKTRGLFTGKRLRRIYIDTSRFATTAGIRVGSSEPAVLAAYHGLLARVPQKYVPAGIDLVLPRGTSNRKMIFSLTHGKVTEISTGRTPEINLVEGCS
ncbi:MAG: hypothetical protein QOH12_1687 [Solirubrobacteraceae bacterium]|nr:hypothetical protein [Solirubrobacteraceae bacterium]